VFAHSGASWFAPHHPIKSVLFQSAPSVVQRGRSLCARHEPCGGWNKTSSGKQVEKLCCDMRCMRMGNICENAMEFHLGCSTM